jgi:hypothetical protein
MHLIIRTAVLILAAACTAVLGPAAPAAQASATTPCGHPVCKIAIFKGGGNKSPAEITVPYSNKTVTTATPETIVTSGWGDLKTGVASLQNPPGGCPPFAGLCSDWRYVGHALSVMTPPDFLANGQLVHGLSLVYTSNGWGGNTSTGVYWPLYLLWDGGCVHLVNYDWVKENPAGC